MARRVESSRVATDRPEPTRAEPAVDERLDSTQRSPPTAATADRARPDRPDDEERTRPNQPKPGRAGCRQRERESSDIRNRTALVFYPSLVLLIHSALALSRDRPIGDGTRPSRLRDRTPRAITHGVSTSHTTTTGSECAAHHHHHHRVDLDRDTRTDDDAVAADRAGTPRRRRRRRHDERPGVPRKARSLQEG